MITVDVSIQRTEGITGTAVMFAEGDTYAMPMPPIVKEGQGAALCAAEMAKRVGCPGHYVCVEQDQAKGHYRFAMVTSAWSFTA